MLFHTDEQYITVIRHSLAVCLHVYSLLQCYYRQNTCIKNGGDLAVFETRDENDFVKQQLKLAGGTGIHFLYIYY